MFTKAEEQFLELYRSGIWDKPVKEEAKSKHLLQLNNAYFKHRTSK